MMNKLFLAAGFAASHVFVAYAAVDTRQSQPDDTAPANFENKCNGKGAICDKSIEHFARCQKFGDLAGEKTCMCGNDYFWDTKKLCDGCKMSTEVFDVIDKNHWSNVYDKVRESYCNNPKKTFEAAWFENEKQPPAHDRNVASPAPVEATPASSKDIHPPNYKELCSECQFTGTVKISLPTPVRVVNVATVTPSATHVAPPVPTAVAAPTSAPFPLNTSAALAVSAEVHLYVIRFNCVAVVEICDTCTVKYIGSNPRVEHEEKIKNMDVAVVEKKTELGLVDAGWCSCVENQVLPGTKVTVAGHAAIAGFDRVSEIGEKEISAGSQTNVKPDENRKPLTGVGPFSPDQGISYPAPVVCSPAPGKEGQPASAPVPKGVVSNEVHGSEVFWPSDRLPVSKAASGSNSAAPASAPEAGSEAAAALQAQDSTSPKQGSQARPVAKTTGGATAVPAGSAVPTIAGVGCLRAPAVLAAVAAVAAAL